MPPKKIVGVAELNIPGPTASTLAAQLKTMSDGKRPITSEQLAKALHCSVGKAEYELNIAERIGLVKRVSQGWIAT